MANPFLFMEEEVAAVSAEVDNSAFDNPFLVDDDDDDEIGQVDYGQSTAAASENPFSASNPFAFTDDGGDVVATTTASDCYSSDTVTQTNASLFLVEDDDDDDEVPLQYQQQQQQETAPTDQVDPTMAFFGTTIDENDEEEQIQQQTKPQRPTPPSQVTQQLITNLTDHLDQTSNNLLGKIPVTRSPSPVSMRDLQSPSPTPDVGDLLDVSESFANASAQEALQQQQAAKPNRPPPPARPVPPRPTPPKQSPVTESTPAIQTPQKQPEDDLLSFGPPQQKKPPPKPPAPKSKDDILSLYSAASQPQKQSSTDLLTEEIDFTEEKAVTSPPEVRSNHIDNIPTIEMSLTTEDNKQDEYEPEQSDYNEFPTAAENVVEIVQEQPQVTTAPPSTVLTPPEQLEKLQFLQERPAEYQAPRPTTPDPIVAQPELAPIFGGPVTTSQSAISPSKVAPPPPVRGGSVLTTVQHSVPEQQQQQQTSPYNAFAPSSVPEIHRSDDFDDFSSKFESANVKSTGNAFLDSIGATSPAAADAWGESDAFGGNNNNNSAEDGFGNDDGFDTWEPPAVPESTPYMHRRASKDSDDEGRDFSVVIKPKSNAEYATAPALAPPMAKSPYSAGSAYSEDSSPRVNPFELGFADQTETKQIRRDSRESVGSGPSTPLFDDDVSQPLEDFPRIYYHGPGWEMQLRQPNKKKITGQRFWKKIFVRLAYQGDNPVVQLLNKDTDKEPFQELPLQGCYSVSEIAAQQFDNFGKIFTVKLQYVFYKEKPGLRPGQFSKAERITSKFSFFAKHGVIDGDINTVKEFGSDLKKLGLPIEHAPQTSELFKIGSPSYEVMKQFSSCIDEALFKLNVHRDRALTYKMEEIQVTGVDEIYVEQNAEGHIEKQIARVRLFFLGFLSGMPDIELGLNDLVRQGKEVVGRHDIIPVATEEWIRLEGVEFHSCVQLPQYEKMRTIKFKPPDACYIELMRFRVRPPKNRELPLQLKATWVVTGNKVQLRADVLVPGYTSRKLGQIPCEDVAIRFPIPECWIYLFRVEKHFRYGSVKSTHRRTGKIKGIERFLGTVETLQESLIEVTSGQAKYEHHHRAIVWRCPRLPKEGQGAYTTHQLICRLALTSFDQIPDQLAPYAFVEFTMPATQVSHTTVRSVSVQESDSDDPPEKCVRYLARHEYRVGIESTMGDSMNAYVAATAAKKPAPIKEEPKHVTPMAQSDSDSDSN